MITQEDIEDAVASVSSFEPLDEPLWLILAHPLGEGFIVAEAFSTNGMFYNVRAELEGFSSATNLMLALDRPDSVIAKHTTEASAKAGVKRAQSAEQSIRLFWQAALEHELKVRNMMVDLVRSSAQPQQ